MKRLLTILRSSSVEAPQIESAVWDEGAGELTVGFSEAVTVPDIFGSIALGAEHPVSGTAILTVSSGSDTAVVVFTATPSLAGGGWELTYINPGDNLKIRSVTTNTPLDEGDFPFPVTYP